MIVTIDGNSSPEEIEKALRKLHTAGNKKAHKVFDAFKYCGIIKLKEDPMAIQKQMRDEWEQ